MGPNVQDCQTGTDENPPIDPPSHLILHPEIPDEGPRLTLTVSTWDPMTDPLYRKPADVDLAGFLVGGPAAPLPGWPESLTGSDHAKREPPPAPTQAEKREKRKAKRSALATRRAAELAALCAQIRAARQAVAA